MPGKLRTTEQAIQRQALSRPQPFPLTGDGAAMENVFNRQSCQVLVDRCDLAAAIAEARYRDWKAQRDRAERPYDPMADTWASWWLAHAEIGTRVKAGAPLPEMFKPTSRGAK